MRINTNMAALNTWKSMTTNQANLQKSLERLSSGARINRAADDAAGLAVSEKMKAQIRGLNMATRNAQDGVSLVQTAEGSASNIQEMLQRMRELAVQASSDSLTDTDRQQLNEEFSQLGLEITRTAQTTKFNGQALLTNAATGTATSGSEVTAAKIKVSVDDPTKVAVDATYELSYNDTTKVLTISSGATAIGTIDHTTGQSTFSINGVTIDASQFDWSSTSAAFTAASPNAQIDVAAYVASPTAASTFTLQIGANNGETIAVNMANLDAATLGVDGSTVSTKANATAALTTLDTALNTVSTTRAKFGSYQNRLDNAINSLQAQAENLTAANSRIRDVDMAAEMAQFTKFQVLGQASTAMLAQANQLSQSVLTLLR